MKTKIESIFKKVNLINKKRTKEGKAHYLLNSTLSESEIIAFEEKYDVHLPEEYRFFLQYIGNGNQETYHRHINSLEESVRFHYTDTTTLPIHLPFPFSQKTGLEIIEELIFDFYPAQKVRNILNLNQEGLLQGCLLLNYEGWGTSYMALVATGEAKGFIWHVEDMYHPFYTRRGKIIKCYTFLECFHYLLDEELASSNMELIQNKQYNKVTNLDLSGESQEWQKNFKFKDIFKCENLESLELSRNYTIQKLPPEIGNLQQLHTFKMNGGSLKHLPDEFYTLKNLEILELSYQSLLTLPKNIGKLHTLKRLSLYWNTYLKRIPKSFAELQNLVYLSLDYCENLDLSQALPIIGKLHKIKYLALKAYKIPKEVHFLRNIESFSIQKVYGEESVEISPYLQYLSHLKSLSLSNCGLREVPQWLLKLKNLEYLSLGDNPIQNLPTNIGDLKNLKYLYLSKTNIKKLPQSLSKLHHLEEIELDFIPNLSIQSVFKVISHLPKIKKLYLSASTKFPPKIGEMPYLEDLIIDSDYKTKQIIPDSISNIKNLYFLRLGFASILELSEGFAKLSKLETLRIETKKIILPKNFGELENLKELNLSNCNIEFLPETFDKLKNLEILYLEGNIHLDLKDTFQKISKLPKLRFLRISAKNLPSEIALCKGLEKLEIYNHPEYKNYTFPLILPDEIGDLINLKYLDLEENHITNLPKSIGKLKKLQYLSLSENNLKFLPLEICNLTNLQELYLSRNKLTSLPKRFNNLKNLYYLDISENAFTRVPDKLGSLKDFIY